MKTKSRVGVKVLLAVAAVLVGLVLLAAVVVMGVNHWNIVLNMNGADTVTLEYGEAYQEEGAAARVSGTLFVKDGKDIPVKIKGAVDSSVLGTCYITYQASFWGAQSSAERTVTVVDTTPPEITLTQSEDSYTIPGQDYEEEGYSAKDNVDGDLTAQVKREEKDGVVYYSVKDSSGNETTVQRELLYKDPVPPEITLTGGEEIDINAGDAFEDPGYTATDNADGDLTDSVKVKGTVEVYHAGTYELTYSVKDSAGNKTKVKRTVNVNAVPQADEVDPDGKVIYLTFDDGPGPYTQQLLDVLEKYNVKATFFVTNGNPNYQDLIGAEAAAGHSVGIHSYSHVYQDIYSSETAFFDDFYKMQDIIVKQTGKATNLTRFPGGSSNTISRHYCTGIMAQLAEDVQAQGFQFFDWNVLSGDADAPISTEQVKKNVIAGVQQHDASVVLQHDIRKFSVDAVEGIIIWGQKNGYTFLPLEVTSPAAHQTIAN